MGILDPVGLWTVLKHVGAKSEPIKEQVPTKIQGHQSSHQTIKYHQYVVGTSQVPQHPSPLGSRNI